MELKYPKCRHCELTLWPTLVYYIT